MNYLKIFIFIILTTIIGCGIDSEDNFPETNVYLEIPITMPEYNNIYGNLWGYEYLNGGIGGIIQKYNWQGDVIWETMWANNQYQQHHNKNPFHLFSSPTTALVHQ